VVVGGVGEATNATGLPTAARRSTQRFGDLTFGISFVLVNVLRNQPAHHIYMSTTRIASSGGKKSEILPTNFMFKLFENNFLHIQELR
jgi:hypothetical protein